MAKLKLLKYPKKPKASASLATKENFIAKVREVDRENAQRKATNAKSEKLSKVIAGIGKAGSRKVSVSPKRRTAKKAPAKKKATRKKRR